MTRRLRWTSIGLALVGAALLAIAVQAGRWWSVAGGDVTIGPLSSRTCMGGTCRDVGLGWLAGSGLWLRAGMATYGGGLIAGFALTAMAGALAAGRAGTLAAGSALVAVFTVTVAAAIFIATAPALPGMGLARGVWLFGAGVVVSAGVAALVIKRGRAVASPRA
ncbi:MAG: hypothetical protein H6709_05840 [Kofleriaceae bacterium]|nr:hypothetical protein [Kofleriaceae bacterium]